MASPATERFAPPPRNKKTAAVETLKMRIANHHTQATPPLAGGYYSTATVTPG